MRRLFILALGLGCLGLSTSARAEDSLGTRTVPLQVTDLQGKVLGHGTMKQVRQGDALDCKIELSYDDGHQTTETAHMTLGAQVIQHSWDWAEHAGGKMRRHFFVDFEKRRAGGMEAKEHGQPDTWVGGFDAKPGTAFAGIGFVYLLEQRWAALAAGPIRVTVIAFLPKPRTATVALSVVGREQVRVEGRTVATERVVIHPEVGWLIKMLANPRDYFLWFEPGNPARWVQSEAVTAAANDPVIRVQVLQP